MCRGSPPLNCTNLRSPHIHVLVFLVPTEPRAGSVALGVGDMWIETSLELRVGDQTSSPTQKLRR